MRQILQPYPSLMGLGSRALSRARISSPDGKGKPQEFFMDESNEFVHCSPVGGRRRGLLRRGCLVHFCLRGVDGFCLRLAH